MDTHEKPMDMEDALHLLCRVHFRDETFDNYSLHYTGEPVPTVQMGAVPGFSSGVGEQDYVQAWLSVRQHILDRRRFFEATHTLMDVTGLIGGTPVIDELVRQAEDDPIVRTLLHAFQRVPQSPRNVIELALNGVLHLSMIRKDMEKRTLELLSRMPPQFIVNPVPQSTDKGDPK